MELTILVLIAVAVLGANFRRRLRHVDGMVERVAKMTVAIQNQSKHIRDLARGTLHLRRLHRNKISIRDRLSARCDEITDLIKRITTVDCRVHVLDDRRTTADLSWVAVINHQDFQGSVLPEATDEHNRQWKVGYRFVVWAPDRNRALDKIRISYPSDAGFTVASIDIHVE
ncbi:MAG: hypothetical protein WCO00_14070 [Rhodospirillaceae bacterium]